MLAARSLQHLKTVADEVITSCPGTLNPHLIEADLTSDSDVRMIVRAAVEKFGRLNILVNNAAAFARGNVAELSPEAWDKVIHTNLRAAYLICHEALPHLLKNPQSDVVNILSTSARRADPGSAAYGASKFGLAALSQSLFAEYRNQGVRVAAIYPSSVDTHERDLPPDSTRPDRLCSEDVADAVLFSLLLPHGVTLKEIELWNTRTR